MTCKVCSGVSIGRIVSVSSVSVDCWTQKSILQSTELLKNIFVILNFVFKSYIYILHALNLMEACYA